MEHEPCRLTLSERMTTLRRVLAGLIVTLLASAASAATIAELRVSAQSTADISRQVREDAEAGGGAGEPLAVKATITERKPSHL